MSDTAEGSSEQTPVRRAVALAIRGSDPHAILVVKRPPEDPDLPGIWGLPAGRIESGETPQASALRVAREKLGIELALEGVIAEGYVDRNAYRLDMVLMAARLVRGEPRVPQAAGKGTQYTAWRWAAPQELRPGAEAGSLCCRLFLDRFP